MDTSWNINWRVTQSTQTTEISFCLMHVSAVIRCSDEHFQQCKFQLHENLN